MAKPSLLWYTNLDENQKVAFEKTLLNSTLVLDRLYHILSKMEEEALKAETSTAQYETPNWQALQAHRNGLREALKKVKSLIGFHKEN